MAAKKKTSTNENVVSPKLKKKWLNSGFKNKNRKDEIKKKHKLSKKKKITDPKEKYSNESLPDNSVVQVFEIGEAAIKRTIKTNQIKPRKNAGVKKAGEMRAGDPFPGRAPVDNKKVKKYDRGKKKPKVKNLKTVFHKSYYAKKAKKTKFAVEQSARSELLLQDTAGTLDTPLVTQETLVSSVDITSATKYFELDLNFGPYKMDYTRNGRFLLLGGKKGHVAAIEWQTKKLLTEINVMESVNDVKWLHQETMFAVAQKQWTYIYDSQGIELHCLKILDHTLQMEYLPYHFLLVAGNSLGFLSYLDTSIGKKVASFRTLQGRLNVMCQNPSNAIIHLGHSNGTVTLWSPNVKKPLVKVLCHKSNVRSVAVDQQGTYMATSGNDGQMKIWDLRTYHMLQSYRIDAGANCLSFSQRGMLAAGIGDIVQIFDECCKKTVTSPYLMHSLPGRVQSTKFCPYEDVLGAGYAKGFQSLLVPGSGEPCFDGFEANPYQSKKQRHETEVKRLLDKIQPEMITLDNSKILQPDFKTVKQIMDEKKQQLTGVNQKSSIHLKHKMKGGDRAGNVMKRKRAVKEETKRKLRKEQMFQQKEKEWKEKYDKN